MDIIQLNQLIKSILAFLPICIYIYIQYIYIYHTIWYVYYYTKYVYIYIYMHSTTIRSLPVFSITWVKPETTIPTGSPVASWDMPYPGGWSAGWHGGETFFQQTEANAFLGGGFNYFYFHPEKMGKIPILTNIFFRWVETTNQFHFGPLFFFFVNLSLFSFILGRVCVQYNRGTWKVVKSALQNMEARRKPCEKMEYPNLHFFRKSWKFFFFGGRFSLYPPNSFLFFTMEWSLFFF